MKKSINVRVGCGEFKISASEIQDILSEASFGIEPSEGESHKDFREYKFTVTEIPSSGVDAVKIFEEWLGHPLRDLEESTITYGGCCDFLRESIQPIIDRLQAELAEARSDIKKMIIAYSSHSKNHPKNEGCRQNPCDMEY